MSVTTNVKHQAPVDARDYLIWSSQVWFGPQWLPYTRYGRPFWGIIYTRRPGIVLPRPVWLWGPHHCHCLTWAEPKLQQAVSESTQQSQPTPYLCTICHLSVFPKATRMSLIYAPKALLAKVFGTVFYWRLTVTDYLTSTADETPNSVSFVDWDKLA